VKKANVFVSIKERIIQSFVSKTGPSVLNNPCHDRNIEEEEEKEKISSKRAKMSKSTMYTEKGVVRVPEFVAAQNVSRGVFFLCDRGSRKRLMVSRFSRVRCNRDSDERFLLTGKAMIKERSAMGI